MNRYSFTSDATDSIGGANGVLTGGATISGGAVQLNGSSGYVDLPNGFIAGLSSATFETWLTDNGSGNWARIFDFGFSTAGEGNSATGTNYLYLTPQSGGGFARAGIVANALGGEQNVDWGLRLPTGSPQHVVWTMDATTQTGRLYVNGSLVGENLAQTFTPAMLGNTVNNWLGRSQWSGDAFLNASINEFRIYNGALTAAEVLTSFNFGPDATPFDGPVTITAQPRSQTVTELSPLNLLVTFQGTPPVGVQWRRNGTAIVGATNASYSMPAMALTNNGASYSVLLTNRYGNTAYNLTSSNALLTVTADTTPPRLVSAASAFPNEVSLLFSEGIRTDTATNSANYTITRSGGTLAVTGVRFGTSISNIVLTTAAQSVGTNYTLTLNNLRDLATAANLIAANTQTNFIGSLFLNVDIGSPATAGVLTVLTNGYNLIASGGGVGGTNDQLSFSFQNYTNDFDVEVRVAGLSFVSAWTRAGLMARDGLATNAAFAAAVATPGPAGCHFESRATPGASATLAGTFPVNYPDTWLRLRRVGAVFAGYASLDGQAWAFLGAASLSLSNVVQVGFALTAGNSNGVTAAQFRDFATGSGSLNTNLALPFEPLGSSSRRTALVISEIMYNPPAAWGTNSLEFVELWNSGLVTEDLTGHKLTGEISYQFPNGTSIAPGQFLVVAKDPLAAQGYYGIDCLGPYANKLANSGGTLRLLNELGGRLLEVEYDNKAPWPVAADGAGHSLVLSRPSYGEGDSRAWSASDVMGGSPGGFEHRGAEPARAVVINEFLAHTDPPQEDFIELYNASNQSVDLSGAWLSDDASTNKFRIPNGTAIPARGFVAYAQTQLGFALAADGEKIFLVNSNQTRVLDAITFDGQENGVSCGRYPNGAPQFQRLATVTQGASNTPPRLRAVVINEIMYHPISGVDEDQYVELFNRSGSAVNLAGWRLQGGIGYTFPSNTVLSAGGYAVVARSATNLLAKYPQLTATNTFGNFSGTLAKGGERIALALPDDLVSTNGVGVVSTNLFYIPVDEVTYGDGGRWGQWSDGGGSSLELIDPDADNRCAASWADSDESSKAAWTSIDVTDFMENGQTGLVNEGDTGQAAPNRFEILSQGDGEMLVDNIEFLSNGSANLVGNGTFVSGNTGWTFGGVLRNSFVENAVGISGSTALHLKSTGRGDTGPNKVYCALSATAATGAPNTGTIRAQVRWLKGNPFLLLRVRGNWLEVSQRLNLPPNCGTPGLPNSRLVANAGPALSDVQPAPILPAANQGVVISVRANDPDNIATVVLRYRIDPAVTYSGITMLDNGTGGDALAGDGIYSATIPGQPGGTLAAFYVAATDGLGTTSQFPAAAPTRECHVRWGESVVAGSIGNYRLWLTAANISFWGSREKNANDPIDATFVYGNSRVIYNVDTLYSGSPFHAPTYDGPMGSMASDYEVNFQPDEKFLGSQPFVLSAYDTVSGNFFFNDDSSQVDLTGNWIARKLGQPANYRRHIHMFVNGLRRGTIYDDCQQPNSEFAREYFPDDNNGQLRKIESWFEFANDGVTQGSVYATLGRTTKNSGGIDPKRYRWNWRPRASESPDDWAPFTNLIAAVNQTTAPNYADIVQTWMDVPNFLRPVIAHHICGSWDSYAYQRGKNMFAYKPDHSGWRLLMWDIEIALGAGGNGPTDGIYNMFDPVLWSLIQNNPGFNREYLRGFQEAVDGVLQPGVADALLDERYASLLQNNVVMQSPQFIKSFISARRSYLQTVLPTAAFSVSNPAYQVVTSSNLLTLTGTAPLGVANILVNGNAYAVTWTSTTGWRLNVPLNGGTNVLNLSATDRLGNVISNATGSVTANYTGGAIAPEGNVVFNEIMYAPAVAGGSYVELFNTHSNYTFDLSGWTINGLGYTFPAGAALPPRGYLTLAADGFAFNQTYGLTNVAFDVFPAGLDDNGETLTLFRPGVGTNLLVVDRVRYEAVRPWPAPTAGVSLQLIDALQDNSRVANWTALTTNGGVQLQSIPDLLPLATVWSYQQASNLDGVNWTATNYNDSAWPSGAGLLAFENNTALTPLINTTLVDPRIGSAAVGSGHAYYFRTKFVVPNNLAGYQMNATGYIDDGAVIYINGVEVSPRLRMAVGIVTNGTLATSQPNGADAVPPDSFDLPVTGFRVGTNFIAVEVHQSSTNSSDIVFGLKLDALYTNSTAVATPGAPNSVAATLPAFPPLWLNEAQANNVTGPLDNNSQHDPWMELLNSASTNVGLAGFYLSDNYTNLTKWAFPGSVTASNGFTLIWCDNQTNQNAANSIHAGLSLAAGAGSLVLSRTLNGATQIVDYLNYAALPANWSYGSVPDGQPFYRRTMFHTTPLATNNGASAPITIFINEWLADNTTTLADPADSQFEDWFELYNPGTNAVDVGGYFLTDNLTNKFQFEIPATGQYVVPAGGYLLVWADNESNQNATNRADLHVNFALSKSGEALGLFAADGTTIDAITFGAQTSNVSEGRFPNGAANIYSMPTPTPRAGNVVPNTAPMLAAISNRVVTLGQTLSVTVLGTDNDLPTQTLTYSLANAPAGAQIGALSGVITWAPSVAPATTNFTVVVADNGTPSLTATQSFSVVTAPVPVTSGYALNGNQFRFNWTTVAGQKFQVEFKDNLNPGAWFPLSGVLVGNGAPLSYTNVLDEAPQRFFRLRVVP